MKKELYMGTIALMLTFVLMYVPIGHAQNMTPGGMNMMGNATSSMNQTASELGKNVSAVLNDAGGKVGSTLNELGQNMSGVGSEIGSDILNETEQTAKKVGIGAADVLSNISGEIKEGIGGK